MISMGTLEVIHTTRLQFLRCRRRLFLTPFAGGLSHPRPRTFHFRPEEAPQRMGHLGMGENLFFTCSGIFSVLNGDRRTLLSPFQSPDQSVKLDGSRRYFLIRFST